MLASMEHVIDMPHRIAAEGSATAGAKAALVSGITGRGILVVTNEDASTLVRLSSSSSGTGGLALMPGASIALPMAEVESVYLYGTGQTVSWAVLKG